MIPAAQRALPLLAAVAILCAAPHLGAATAPPTRPGASSRPSVLALTKLNGVDHVKLSDLARHVGLAGSWLRTGQEYRLAEGSSVRALFENGSREARIDGVRVFLGSPVLPRGRDLYVSRIDAEGLLTGLFRPALATPRLVRPRIIAIDPGHGGEDPGKERPTLGLQEKALTLDLSLRLERLLKDAGYQVVLTRRDDRHLSTDKQTDLRLRSQVANNAAADLFISIHLNALDNAAVSGTEVYTFPPQHQRSANSWGVGRSDAEDKAAPVNRYDAWSASLGHAVHREIIGKLKTSDRGQKTLHLGVLRAVDAPAILVESAFLSNDAEARRVATPQYRQQIAEAIAAGIARYSALIEASGRPGGK